MTIRSALTAPCYRLGYSLAATALLAVSAHAQEPDKSPRARSEKAMDTCIAAFIAANLPKEQPVSVRKEDIVASPLNPHNRGYRIVLTATGATSGKQLAKGSCTIDSAGTVIALNGKRAPLLLAQEEIPTAEKTAAR